MPAEKINIEVSEQGAIIKVLNTDGTVNVRSTTCQGFMDAFRTEDIATPRLPPGTLLYARGGGKEKVLFTVPPAMMKTNWMLPGGGGRIQIMNLPMPRLLYKIEIADGRCTRNHIYALKEYPKTLTEQLYLFPYGNAYEDGNVCWGGHKRNEIKTILDSIYFHTDFLNSIFNGHVLQGLRLEDIMAADGLTTIPGRFWHPIDGGRNYNGQYPRTVKELWDATRDN